MPSNLKTEPRRDRPPDPRSKSAIHNSCRMTRDDKPGSHKTRQKMIACHTVARRHPRVGIMQSLDLISSLVQEQIPGQNPVARRRKPQRLATGCRANSILSRNGPLSQKPSIPSSVRYQNLVRYPSGTAQPQAAPWWRRSGSNRRPTACKAVALPAELRPQKGHRGTGGPSRTRTYDLTLIRGAL